MHSLQGSQDRRPHGIRVHMNYKKLHANANNNSGMGAVVKIDFKHQAYLGMAACMDLAASEQTENKNVRALLDIA